MSQNNQFQMAAWKHCSWNDGDVDIKIKGISGAMWQIVESKIGNIYQSLHCNFWLVWKLISFSQIFFVTLHFAYFGVHVSQWKQKEASGHINASLVGRVFVWTSTKVQRIYLSTQNQNSDSKVIEHKGLLKLSSQNLQIHLEANLKVTKMSDFDKLSVESFLTPSFFQQVLLVVSKLHFGLDFQWKQHNLELPYILDCSIANVV